MKVDLNLNKIEDATEKTYERYVLLKHRLDRQIAKEGETDETLKMKNMLTSIHTNIEDLIRHTTNEIARLEDRIKETYTYPSTSTIKLLNKYINKGKDEYNEPFNNEYNLTQTYNSEGEAIFEFTINIDDEDQTFQLEIDKHGKMIVVDFDAGEDAYEYEIYSIYNINQKLLDAALKVVSNRG